MARRRSMIASSIDTLMREAHARTAALHLDNANIPFAKIVGDTFDTLHDELRAAKHAVPRDLQDSVQWSEGKLVTLLMPFDDWPTSNTPGKHRTGEEFKASPTTYEAFCAPYEAESSAPYYRGLSISLRSEKSLPFMGHYTNAFDEVTSRTQDGMTLTPERVGEGYAEIRKRLRQVTEMLMMLQYMEDFAKQTALHITTPGICKRVWPEAVHFLSPSTASDIRHAKQSAWPSDLKGRLSDLQGGDHRPTSVFLHKQLKAIADVVLAAKLMPDMNSYKYRKLRLIGVTPVRIPVARS